jgi:hypothetical protein
MVILADGRLSTRSGPNSFPKADSCARPEAPLIARAAPLQFG